MALGRDLEGFKIRKGLRGLHGVKGFMGFYRAITGLTGVKSLRGLTQSDDSSSSHIQWNFKIYRDAKLEEDCRVVLLHRNVVSFFIVILLLRYSSSITIPQQNKNVKRCCDGNP